MFEGNEEAENTTKPGHPNTKNLVTQIPQDYNCDGSLNETFFIKINFKS